MLTANNNIKEKRRSDLYHAGILERLIRFVNNDIIFPGGVWYKVREDHLNMLVNSYYGGTASHAAETRSYSRVYFRFIKDLRYRQLNNDTQTLFKGAAVPSSAEVDSVHAVITNPGTPGEKVELKSHKGFNNSTCVDNLIEGYEKVEDSQLCKKLDDLVDSTAAALSLESKIKQDKYLSDNRMMLDKFEDKLHSKSLLGP